MADKKSQNVNELLNDCSEKVRGFLATFVELYQTITWKTISIEIPLIPEPSHRPRLSGYRVYVPGAAKNQRYFNNHVLPKLRGLFITTPCKIKLDIYCQTPKSFNKLQKVIAEMGYLRPWVNTGDVDNFEKAVYDMMQPNEKRGHTGIMENDCLIVEAHTNKYYSVNPRYELKISYMDKIPPGILKTLRLKGDEIT